EIPIIGMGGISNFEDVVEFIRVGSTMVQVGTLNYRDPSLISKMNDKLKNFLTINKINDISELIGNYSE
ncbi:MAG: dihydroorotate dehydrogenase, partial [Candidatus Marinimicrobia bacterium]|nr:dihydroorotate dehydrogenase [Candidatus Neomarinimicrobiota bacterium]